MRNDQREKLIESVGIETADTIETLQKEIEALHDYLKVARVYSTVGFRLVERHEPAANTSKRN
jgi:hypothetical protein